MTRNLRPQRDVTAVLKARKKRTPKALASPVVQKSRRSPRGVKGISSDDSCCRMSPSSFPVRRLDRVEQSSVCAVGAEDCEGDDHGHGAVLHGVSQIKLNCEAA